MLNHQDIESQINQNASNTRQVFLKVAAILMFSALAYFIAPALFYAVPLMFVAFRNPSLKNAAKSNTVTEQSILSIEPKQSYEDVLKSFKRVSPPQILKDEITLEQGEKVMLTALDNMAALDTNNATNSGELVFKVSNVEHGTFGNATHTSITSFKQKELNGTVYFQHDNSQHEPNWRLVVQTKNCQGATYNCTSLPSEPDVNFTKTSTDKADPKVVAAAAIIGGVVGISVLAGVFFLGRTARRAYAEKQQIRNQDPKLYDFLDNLGMKNIKDLMNDTEWQRVYGLIEAASPIDEDNKTVTKQQVTAVYKARAQACISVLKQFNEQQRKDNGVEETMAPSFIDTYLSNIESKLQEKMEKIVGRISVASRGHGLSEQRDYGRQGSKSRIEMMSMTKTS